MAIKHPAKAKAKQLATGPPRYHHHLHFTQHTPHILFIYLSIIIIIIIL